MDQRAQELIKQGDNLFSKRGTLMALWQEIADNFYPERGHFTVSRNLGTDFAGHLTTSYPLLARRDLGNSISAMLRPSGQEWFAIKTGRDEIDDVAGRTWLEAMTQRQRRAMYDRASMFTRATKEGDHDFAAFGQCVLTVELNRDRDTLLYRCWHLADTAWCENHQGKPDTVHRKWKPTALDLSKLFPGKLHQSVVSSLNKEPYKEFNVRHIVLPSDQYGELDKAKRRYPYVSIYIDVDNEHVMEETPLYNPMYVIPRWQTVSGSQYAHSPATVCALPDARLIQSITLSLLIAGEKAADPPMIGVQEAFRSDLDIKAGGFTAVDADYDERLGEVLRPITQDYRGLPVGIEMSDRTVALIKEAFFLNKLSMPPAGGTDMTAYEVGQRVQEYIRQAAPLFEPMEAEYNGGVCEATFDLLLRGGLFGPAEEIPDSLKGQDIQFRFESPLTEATERKKGQQFLEAQNMLAQAAQLDPSVVGMIDAQQALRDVLTGIGTPAKWMRDEDTMAQMAAEQKQAADEQAALAQAQQGADIAATVGKASQAMQMPASP